MPDGAVYTLRRDRLTDGACTTVYVVRYPRERLRAQVRIFRQPRRLDFWCHKHSGGGAGVGDLYRRAPFRPLGDVWIDGRAVSSEPFPPRYRGLRPVLEAGEDGLRITRPHDLAAASAGSRLQAGPLLVDDGRVVFDEASDAEGFRAGSGQFDSDITEGRHPRAAIGLGSDHVTVLACDGRRSLVDAGLTMTELAEAMRALHCEVAMNLDGGGSTTLVHRGHLLNRPYTDQDQPAPASRPIVSALLLYAV